MKYGRDRYVNVSLQLMRCIEEGGTKKEYKKEKSIGTNHIYFAGSADRKYSNLGIIRLRWVMG